ncbi:cysteine peptidase histidine active site [Lucifera butyrica]|uniref:Cysteine peptidase histidine active site n=1 Tax=Lucifera butyrica TaxID=1351585 RepID=A0A498RKY0_9FIRM|nr:C1 family peptidase [Lucifera butyrica]VBB09718.1 cysteine peptidase histidine active site [Lucifera butyrica]
MPMRKYLLKKDSLDLRDYIFCSAQYQLAEHLPAQVDLRAECSPIVDQGKLGSCTANAIASGLREYLELKARQSLTTLSRLFLYYEERSLEGTISEDSGAEIRDGMKVLKQIGVCPEADWPYDISTFTNPPTDKDIADAARYKIGEYHRITSLAHLKAALAEGLPVVIGIDVYESFESEEVARTGIVPIPDTDKEQFLGGHAVLVVGYDNKRDMLIVRNSWGSSWGDKGYFYLPYGFYNKGLVSDCWTSRG